MKRPAFQFYPADWRKDLELQSCRIGARGLWWELSCLMHEAEPYGHLTLNGVAMPDDKAARAVRVELREYKRLLAEIEDAGVSSRTAEGGILFSRRMVRDEHIRNERAAGGKDGAHHGAKGAEHGSKGGRPKSDKGGEITPLPSAGIPPKYPPPSSSSSSSASTIGGTTSLLSGEAPDAMPLNGHEKTKATVDEAKAVRTQGLTRDARGILEFLNEKAHKKFPPTDSNVGIIVARLRQGFTPEQIRAVVGMKVRKWGTDQDMREYLRPETLFGAKKFSGYVGELVDLPEEPPEEAIA